MQAYPRLVSPDPDPSQPSEPAVAAGPSIPATSERDPSSPEPFWPRLTRALALMFLAIALHVWGVRSPHPQEPVYAVLASRLVGSMLGSPAIPLAPPLQVATGARSTAAGRVTVEISVLNVPPVPGPPVSTPATVDARLVPVGTSGIAIARAADTPDVAPHLAPAGPPEVAALDAAPTLAAPAEARPAPTSAALMTALLGEPRVEAAALSPERPAPSASRVALPADRKETDPRDAAEDQRRQEEVVLAVLHEYTRALERFDVGATKAVYPSVDDRELRQSFEDVETQRFQFGKCGVSFSSSGHDANAWCIGNSTFKPKVGSRVIKYSDQAWQFTLARDGGGWQIRKARFQ